MDWNAYVRTHLATITGDAARDADIVEELSQHLSQRFDEARASGATVNEAFLAATRELEAQTRLARTIREADAARDHAPAPPPVEGFHLMRDLWQDIHYAVRLLVRQPGFTIATVLTLALGIGATAAIFSVVDGVLLRPSPFPEGPRLMMIWGTDRASGTSREPSSFPDYMDLRQRSRAMERVAAFVPFDAFLQPDRGDSVRLAALATTPEVFELLGVHPLAGRLYADADDRPDAPATALISERLWNSAYARGDVVGGAVRINDQVRTIVGIVPSGADFGVTQVLRAADYGGGFAVRDPRTRVDVWLPLQGDARTLPRSAHPLFLIGRLSTRVAAATAQQELSQIARDLEREYPTDNDARGVDVQPLQDAIFGSVGPPLTMLMAAVTLLLLMTCANVANLLLTRAVRRGHEVALRSALGGRMNRLVRQFLAENIVLSLSAGILAVVFAEVSLRGLLAFAPGHVPRLAEIAIDARLFAMVLGCSVAIGVIFSLVPVLQTRRRDLETVFRADNARSTSGRDGRWLRSGLVVSEVALAVVLVAGAGLLIKSFWQLRTANPGFAVAGVLKADFVLPPSRYPVQNPVAPSSIQQFNEVLVERLSKLPGVDAVSLAANHPLDGGSASSFAVVGREAEAATWPEVSIRAVAPSYFETLRIPLISGRYLRQEDGAEQPVVVINRQVKERFFPTQDPVGQRLVFWGTPRTIVGVVDNERSQGVAKAAPIAVYLSLATVSFRAESVVVRTSGDPTALASSVRAAFRTVDPLLVVFGVEPLEETLSQSLAEQRFLMLLLASFAAVALALAAIGIHGVLSYRIAHRTREIGIQMALGADARKVVRMVVTQGATLTALGLLMGIVLALALGRFLSGLLIGVAPSDATTLAAVVIVLSVVAMVSVWLPARRAVRIDPLVALRQD